jgi:hypothetical protein
MTAAGQHRAEWARQLARARIVGMGVALVAGSSLAIVHVTEGGSPTGLTARPAVAASAPAAAAGSGIPLVERPARPEGAPGVDLPPPSPPESLEIPAIGVSSTLEELSIDGDGALAPPSDYQRAGWFTPGPEPGQPGPAVIAGHVDSRDGPAVFLRLDQLTAGDEVVVHRQDGRDVRFSVTDVHTYPKDAFPATEVYGPVPGPELRLITCGGDFDRSAGQYRANVVVYAVAATS